MAEIDAFTMEAYDKRYANQQLSSRGKELEKALRDALKKEESLNPAFDYERIPDAHSTRGALKAPRTGDFIAFHKGVTTVIEAKQVHHDYRLPVPNFPASERGRLRRREMAGIRVLIVVMHSTNDTYRCLPLSYFDTKLTGSWDMSNEPTKTLQEVMNDIKSNK